MSIFMTLADPDSAGHQKPTGFYHTNVIPESDIPQNAIEITAAQFDELTSNRSSRRWKDGQVVEYAAPVDQDAAIAARQTALNKELGAYIYGIYDAGTQASMQAIWSQDTTPAAVKSDIEAVWAWIALIMTYYYQCKSEIAALTDADVVAAYTWDFSQFDASCPAVTLQGIFEAIY